MLCCLGCSDAGTLAELCSTRTSWSRGPNYCASNKSCFSCPCHSILGLPPRHIAFQPPPIDCCEEDRTCPSCWKQCCTYHNLESSSFDLDFALLYIQIVKPSEVPFMN